MSSDISKKNKITITGMGAVNPLGRDVFTFMKNLQKGKSGLRHLSSKVKELRGKKTGLVSKRPSKLIINSMREAVKDARLSLPSDVTIVFGSAFGQTPDFHKFLYLKNNLWGLISNMRILKHFKINNFRNDKIVSEINDHFSLRANTYNVSSASTSDLLAVSLACELIRIGRANVVVVVGYEIFRVFTSLFLQGLNLLSVEVSKPFDKKTDGFNISEGASVLVIENYDHAVKRGGRIHAEIVSWANTSYIDNNFSSCSKGIERTITKALERGGISAEDIDYIMPHGNGVAVNDYNEIVGIKKVLGGYLRDIPLSTYKPRFGYMLGASGIIDLIIIANFMREDIILRSCNQDINARSSLRFVVDENIHKRVNIVLKIAVGMNGSVTALLMKRPA